MTEGSDNIYSVIGKTFSGLENLLMEELQDIGIKKPTPIIRGVAFKAHLEDIYRINYCCRYALRFLVEIRSFQAIHEDMLYQGVRKIAWDDLLNVKQTFAVYANVVKSNISHSHYAALKAKDAIVDYFREKYGLRPSVDKLHPEISIHLYIHNNQCMVSLDSSGEALFKRGYRKSATAAPLNEVLAAGMVALSDWKKDQPLFDPMCGSGTIPTEAAMKANNIPSGFFRSEFGFMHWGNYNKRIWADIKHEADQHILHDNLNIHCSDINKMAIDICRKNFKAAGLERKINLAHADFFKKKLELNNGILIINPPYGERMNLESTDELYNQLGNVLKQNYSGNTAWILSSDMKALKHIGLHAERKIKLFNGPLECRFIKLSLYESSRKKKHQNPDN